MTRSSWGVGRFAAVPSADDVEEPGVAVMQTSTDLSTGLIRVSGSFSSLAVNSSNDLLVKDSSTLSVPFQSRSKCAESLVTLELISSAFMALSSAAS